MFWDCYILKLEIVNLLPFFFFFLTIVLINKCAKEQAVSFENILNLLNVLKDADFFSFFFLISKSKNNFQLFDLILFVKVSVYIR